MRKRAEMAEPELDGLEMSELDNFTRSDDKTANVLRSVLWGEFADDERDTMCRQLRKRLQQLKGKKDGESPEETGREVVSSRSGAFPQRAVDSST